MRPVLLILIALLCGFMVGCDNAPPAGPRVPAASVRGTVPVGGRVTLDAPAPERKLVRNTPCCPDAPPTQLDEAVVVGADRGLANVFVYLEGGPLTDGAALPPVLLDQKFCRYVPHVVGVVVGQTLNVRSSDATYHNVNIRPDAGSAVNLDMHAAGETKATRFAAAGFAPTKCDVHDWMRGWIGVFDNPFFAVTDPDGRFALPPVPPGTYTLVARHEQYGTVRKPITVDARAAAVAVDFSYHPPTP